jgi:hypothetical protein
MSWVHLKLSLASETPATADSLGQCLTGQNNLNATILNAPYEL